MFRIENNKSNGYIYRGEWESGKYFTVNDIVRYSGSTYCCIQSHTATSSILPTDTSYWTAIVNGYIQMDNGLKIEWGLQTYSKSVSGGDNKDGASITFPLAFSVKPSINVTHFDGNQFNMTAVSRSATGFTPRYRNVNTSNSATTNGCSWIAIGF